MGGYGMSETEAKAHLAVSEHYTGARLLRAEIPARANCSEDPRFVSQTRLTCASGSIGPDIAA